MPSRWDRVREEESDGNLRVERGDALELGHVDVGRLLVSAREDELKQTAGQVHHERFVCCGHLTEGFLGLSDDRGKGSTGPGSDLLQGRPETGIVEELRLDQSGNSVTRPADLPLAALEREDCLAVDEVHEAGELCESLALPTLAERRNGRRLGRDPPHTVGVGPLDPVTPEQARVAGVAEDQVDGPCAPCSAMDFREPCDSQGSQDGVRISRAGCLESGLEWALTPQS